MSEKAQVQPENKTVVDSLNLHLQTKKVETATNIYAGRLVKKGTTDAEVVVNANNTMPIGWVSYEHTPKKYRPASISDAFNADDYIAVVNGAGIIVKAALAPANAVSKGSPVYAADNGCVGVSTTTYLVGYAEETVSNSGGATPKAILVRSAI